MTSTSVTSIRVNPPAIAGSVSGHKRVAFSTLGCKVNLFESEFIAQKLATKEYQRVDPSDQADIYVINTCTVTAEADRQARQVIRKVIRANPSARVVVTGCYAQMDPQACANIPGVDLVVGNSQKLDIPELLDDMYQTKAPSILMRDIDKEISLPDQLLQGFEGRTRAFVQIQQGCDQGCTFCIIHVARGKNRSFPSQQIKQQCQQLILNGYAEIVLCGVDIGSYGSDFAEQNYGLTNLIREILEIKGDYRVRLSSIDPVHITESLIEMLKGNQKICPQLHLSLQSANTLILKRMKRRATRALIYDRIGKLRAAIPNLVLSADILVGFPTESEDHFQDTLTAIAELEIAYPHVFKYSNRQGTPASRIPSQISSQTKKNRARRARIAGESVWQRVAKRQVGQRRRVVIESSKSSKSSKSSNSPNKSLENPNKQIIGRSANYFPVHIDLTSVLTPAAPPWADVEIVSVGEKYLRATLLD